MRLNNLVAKPFLLAALAILGACHDDDKPEPEHQGCGELFVTVENPGKQDLALRIFSEELPKPLEERFEADKAPAFYDAWLPIGQYDALLTTYNPTEVTIDAAGGFNTATAYIPATLGMPALTEPVYVATQSDIAIAEGKTKELTLQPKDIRKILRLTVTAPDALTTSPLDMSLAGIACEINLATNQITSFTTLRTTLPAPDAQHISRATAGILGVAWPESTTSDVNDKTHLLVLTWQAADGSKATYSENVSDQLRRATEAGVDTLDLAISIPAKVPDVPIHLYTGIRTRATIDAFDGTPVNIAMGHTAGQYTESWEGNATQNEIMLTPERYYPSDGSSVYLRGYYPAAPLENGKVKYSLTGQEDLMLSVEQNGSLSKPFDEVKTPLTYRHLLSQLNFTLKLKGASANYRIRSVHINGLASTAIVDLSTEVVEPLGKTDPVAIYTDPGTGGFPITDGVVTLPGYILVQPDAELTLDLVLNIDGNPENDLVFKNLPVNFTGGGTEGGSAYEVEISLEIPDPKPDPDPDPDPDPEPDPEPTPDPGPANGIKVTISAKVIDWKPGDQGGITIDPY